MPKNKQKGVRAAKAKRIARQQKERSTTVMTAGHSCPKCNAAMVRNKNEYRCRNGAYLWWFECKTASCSVDVVLTKEAFVGKACPDKPGAHKLFGAVIK